MQGLKARVHPTKTIHVTGNVTSMKRAPWAHVTRTCQIFVSPQ